MDKLDKFDLICKFVYLEEKEVGETIDVYEQRLIVKMGAKFAGIPLKNIEKVDGEKVYISGYDEGEAFEIGEKWEEEKSKPVSMEELKIFGFGEEAKNRFSVILKEIGDYPNESPESAEREGNLAERKDKEGGKGERKLGEGIIDKL
jgi:hypothetical protein